MSSVIEQEVTIPASPERVYRALTDAAEFSALSGGAPASIGTEPGETFSCFGGMIGGRQVELLPNRRIVQAWRVANWEEGRYSIARFELEPSGEGTTVRFQHLGFPDAEREHLDAGWHANYWEPLRRHLA